MSVSTTIRFLPEHPPAAGDLVQVRSRRWLVEEVVKIRPGQSPWVTLACAEDDAQGEALEVFWEAELDRQIVEEEGWRDPAAKGFDAPRQHQRWQAHIQPTHRRESDKWNG